MSMPVQMSPVQDDKRPKVDDQRLYLANDLKEAQDTYRDTITSHKTRSLHHRYKISHENQRYELTYDQRLLSSLIMESLVKKKQKGAILELKRRHLKNIVFCTYTPYPAMKIRCISASSAQETRNDQFPIRRAAGYQQGKVLEFFDCPGPQQGVEDLRELLYKGAQGDRAAESGMSKVSWAEDTTMFTYLVNRSSSSAIGFKTHVDMLGFFGWLASIKQGMLEPVKVKCIFLGYRKGIVGNKLWRLDDVTSKVVLYRNMGFNKRGEYKKTFIGSGIARDREQHSAWELFSYREDSNEAAFAVALVDTIYAHELLTFNNTVACEVIFKSEAGLKDDMDARSDVYVLNNGCKICSDDSDSYYWEYTPAKGNVLGMEIIRDQSGNTLRVSQSRFYNGKLIQTLLEGHSILSLKGSLSGDYEKNGKWSCIYAVGSQEYQMVCTRLDIASADVGSLKANLQHMEALSTTKAGYMTFTEAWKKEIWLKGILP
ncbi:hypothetical protein Tco_0874580 [Tanacetum coccineum]|uniref:Zinc finger, CCHC-type n=1 Tax=Tanacetum coccineum TaxID=301880 RepID=A0ABQ5BNQ6_9ASTR